MTDVTVCVRQSEITRPSNKAQKRPLSIIREYDSDDPDATDFSKHNFVPDNAAEDTITNIITESAKTHRADESGSLALETTLTSDHANSLPKHEIVTDSLTFASKPQSERTHQSLPASKYNIRQQISKPQLFIPDSDIPVSDVNHGPTPTRAANGYANAGDENESNQLAEKSKSLRLMNSENSTLKHQHQQHNLPSTRTDSGEIIHCDSAHTDSQSWPTHGGDSQGLARIKEAAERLHLPSPLSTASLSCFPNHRPWTHTSTSRTLNDFKSPAGQNLQQISLTSNGSTPALFPLTFPYNHDNDNVTEDNDSNATNDNNSISQPLPSRVSLFSSSILKASKLSAYFARRMSNESVGSLSESDLSDGDIGSEDGQSSYLSDFRRLQETAEKLRLSIRRPSTMLWRQQYVESQGLPRLRSNLNVDVTDERLTSDRKQKIDKAIEWLRHELVCVEV